MADPVKPTTTQLLNLTSGEVEDVPADSVTQAVGSGKYSLPKGRVEVVSDEGKRGTIDASDAQKAFAGGFRYVTPGELVHEEREAKYGDSPLKAGALGFVRGASFGLSAPILDKTHLVPKEDQEGYKEFNSTADTVGEVTGTVAPALIPGGQFTAAGGVARLGAAATEATVGALGKSLAGRALASGIGAAAEGTLYGLGTQASEDLLENKEVTAQKLAASVGVNALLGFGVGAGVSVAGAKLKRLLGSTAQEEAEASAHATEATQPPTHTPTEEGEVVDASPLSDEEAVARAGAQGKAAGEALEGGAKKLVPRAKAFLEGLGLSFPTKEDFVLRDLDLTKSQATKLRESKFGGLGESAPKAILDDARYPEAKTLGQKLELIQTKREEAAQDISDSVARFDELAKPGLRPNYPDMADKIEEQVIAPLRKGTSLNKPIVERLEEQVADIRNRPNTTFSDAEELKRSFDPHLKWDSSADAPMRDALRKVRGIINGEIESKAAKLAQSAGGEDAAVFQKWKDAKRLYAGMSQLEDMVGQRADAREVGNRFFSLTDNLAGAAAVAAHGFNPVGIASAWAAATVNKWGRERLPQIIALQLKRYEENAAVRSAAKGLQRMVEGATEGAAETAGAATDAAMGASAVAGEAGAAAAATAAKPFGEYTEALAQAAAKGAAHVFALHALLSDSDEAYRAMMQAHGVDYGEDDKPHVRRAQGLEVIQASADKADARTNDAFGRLLTGKPAQTSTPSRGDRLKNFKTTTDSLAQLVASPDQLNERLAKATVGLGAVAPQVSTSLMAAAQRAVQYLHEAAPKAPPSPLDLPALSKPWAPSDAELSKFEAKLAAVSNPYGTLENAVGGKVTADAVAAIQAVYPEWLADQRTKLLEKLGTHPYAVPYRTRLMLGTLFGKAVDSSATPESVAVLQALHATRAPQPKAPSGPAPRSQLAASTQTQTEALLSRR